MCEFCECSLRSSEATKKVSATGFFARKIYESLEMSPRNHLIIHLRKKNNQITSKADHSDNITDLINNEVRLKTRKAIPLASKENNVGGILAKKSTKKVNNGLTSKLSKKNKEKTKENEPSGNAVNSGTSLTGTQNADAENGIENVIKPKKTKKKLKQDLPSKLSEEIEKTCEKTGIDSSGNGVDSGTSLTHTQNADLQENEEKIEQLDVTYFWEDDDVAFQLFEDSFDDPIELPSSPIKPEISPTQSKYILDLSVFTLFLTNLSDLSQISSPAKVSSSIHVDESSPVAKKPKTTPTKRNGRFGV